MVHNKSGSWGLEIHDWNTTAEVFRLRDQEEIGLLITRNDTGGGELVAFDVPIRRLLTQEFRQALDTSFASCPVIQYTDDDIYIIPLSGNTSPPNRVDPDVYFIPELTNANSLNNDNFGSSNLETGFSEGLKCWRMDGPR